MNGLDKLVRAERRRRYKRLKRLFKARDMSSKYVKRIIPVSKLDNFFNRDEVNYQTISCLAKDIVDYNNGILGLSRPKPPNQKSVVTKKQN